VAFGQRITKDTLKIFAKRKQRGKVESSEVTKLLFFPNYLSEKSKYLCLYVKLLFITTPTSLLSYYLARRTSGQSLGTF
jgi:hypothetical protein